MRWLWALTGSITIVIAAAGTDARKSFHFLHLCRGGNVVNCGVFHNCFPSVSRAAVRAAQISRARYAALSTSLSLSKWLMLAFS